MRRRKIPLRYRPRINGITFKQANELGAHKTTKRFFLQLHEVEVVYSGPKISESVKIKSSRDAYDLCLQLFDKRKLDYKEMFYVILLNRAQYCIWYSQIGTGSTSTIIINIKEIFQLALKANASGIILAHNHPSGSITPSDSDIRITRQVKSACGVLDMILIDHLIITKEKYYSMADDGDL